jgi:hypothetical protein
MRLWLVEGFAHTGRVQRVLITRVVEPNIFPIHCSPKPDEVLTASVC